MPSDLKVLEERLGHSFRDQALLVRALTHRSFAFDLQIPDNEQFEFLGDSILGFLVSDSLVRAHPTYREGRLSKMKAHLVSAVRLHQVALRIELGTFLQVGRSEEMSGGRQKKAILSDALEAVIASLYLDGDLETARRFVVEHVIGTDSIDDKLDGDHVNHKSNLQEKALANRLPLPIYSVVEAEGPGHARTFTVEAKVGKTFSSRGTSTTKKAAAQEAARKVLEQMDSLGG